MKQAIIFLFAAVLLPLLSAGQVQTINGNIYDEASRAPITGAVITVLGSTPARGGVTDIDGHFRIDSVLVGRQSFRITYLSYEDRLISDVQVTAGKEVNLNVGMQEAVHNMKEVTITYDRSRDKNRTINDMALVSARSFNVDETKRYAGSFGDPSRMAANFAGIVSGNDSRNDIVVRGNSPTGMLWQIEGLNAPNPNHFGTLSSTGGPVSMLNNNNIDKSDFLTGAFPAQYGNALAGVFDIKLRTGNANKAEYVAQVGFNGFEGGAEGPIGKKKQASYLINYRYSTLGVFKTLGLNLGTGSAVPVYQDANYKLTTKAGKSGKLSFFGIMGASKADFLGKDIDTTKPDLYGGDQYKDAKSKFASTINGLSYEHQLSERASTKFIAGYTTTYQHYTGDSISNVDGTTHADEAADFATGKIALQWIYMHKFSAKDNLQAGLTYENTRFDIMFRTMEPGQPDRVYADQTGNMGLEQGFAQWKHRFSKDFSFIGGVHMQYLDMNGSLAVEPRGGFSYSLNSRNAFSLGYGMHSQAQNVYTYFVQTPTATGVSYTNKELGFTRSQHVVGSYNYNVTPHMRIKAEGYYQHIDKAPVAQRVSPYSALNSGAGFGLDNEDSLVNSGTGTNYGAELTVEHFLTKGFYFLVTASLINSKYKGSDGVERNTAFNSGHVLNALAGKEFAVGKGGVLGLNVKASSVGGRYLTPIDLAASQAKGSAVYLDNLAYSEKQTDYFRVDFKLSYRKEYRRSTMEFAIDLQNMTNNKNIFSQAYDAKKNRIVNNYQQGFFPVPMFRYTF
ncbi:MAG: TonB-dependent receptor [Bacteroidota bacterium]